MSAPHVIRRRRGFYLRLRVPRWLAPHLGRSHVVQSLNTSDAMLAAGRAAGAAACWKQAFGELRRMAKTLSDEELSAVARHWYARCARAGVREWLQALAPGELADARGDAGECARRVVASQGAVDGADGRESVVLGRGGV